MRGGGEKDPALRQRGVLVSGSIGARENGGVQISGSRAAKKKKGGWNKV